MSYPIIVTLAGDVSEETRNAVVGTVLACNLEAMEHPDLLDDIADKTADLFDGLNVSVRMGIAVLLYMLDTSIRDMMETVPSGQKALEEIEGLWPVDELCLRKSRQSALGGLKGDDLD